MTGRIERSVIYRLLLLAGLVSAIAGGLRRGTPPGERLFLLFAAGTILWTAAIGIAMEFGENNRFRYPILGLSWILVLVAVRNLVRAVTRRWTVRRGSTEPAPRRVRSEPGPAGASTPTDLPRSRASLGY